ncbi:MAG: MarC family protein [Pseudomonadota bacterium]|jgi:multiple antibiotic resistance protein|nr:MarC family protein [Pseudomonadota bacterium]
MIDQLLKFFVTFLVVVEPIGVIPIFIAMTEGVAEKERRRMARKAVLIAGAIFLLFAIGGGQFLRLLGISLDAFRIFGGLLLLLIALEMVFARESGSRSSTSEVEEGKARSDISVFPLAFPFIAGPGSLTTILLYFGPASHDPLLFGGLLACVALALLCALGTLYLVTPINRAMGVTGANVLNRLFGVVLGALAAQYVLDGLRGSLLAPAGSG